MELDNSVITYICTTYYDIIPIGQSIKKLWGYEDRNFSLVDSSDHQTYILKIINEQDSRTELMGGPFFDEDIIDEILDSANTFFKERGGEFVVPKLIRTTANKLSTLVYVNFKNSTNGDLICQRRGIRLFEYFDGPTVYDFVQSKLKSGQHREGHQLLMPPTLAATYFQVGRLCNHLFEFLHTQNHLIERLAECRLGFSWQLSTCEHFIAQQCERFHPEPNDERRLLVEQVLREYSGIKAELAALPKFIVHGDPGQRNILMDPQTWKPTCLIDFGDLQVGYQLTDLAVAALYAVLELDADAAQYKRALEEIPAQMLGGYQLTNRRSCKLADGELNLMLTLMKLRLCQSLMNAQLARINDPGNSCALTTLASGWTLLEILVRDTGCADRIAMAEIWRGRQTQTD